MSGSEIVISFLGTGSAIPPNSRQQVSFTLRHGSGLCIFDCGEGTQYALRKMGISTRKQIIILLSHLHSDHFLGLPGLLSSFQLQGRKEEILVIGPKGTSQTVQNIVNAYFVKFEYTLKVQELSPKAKYEGKGFSVTAVKANHNGAALSYIWKENDIPGKVDSDKIKALGIPSGPLIGELQKGKDIIVEGKTVRSQEVVGPVRPGRVVVYSGDTAYNGTLAKSIPPNSDILVHEATYPTDMTELAEERKHSTFTQAAKIAAACNPKQLILTHISPRVVNLKQELELAKHHFNNTIVAKEGMTITLPYPYS